MKLVEIKLNQKTKMIIANNYFLLFEKNFKKKLKTKCNRNIF